MTDKPAPFATADDGFEGLKAVDAVFVPCMSDGIMDDVLFNILAQETGFATADGRAWPYEPPHVDPQGPEDFEPWAVAARFRHWPLRIGKPHHNDPHRF